MALQPGVRIGSYEIRCLLGAGGMGEVYRAHDSHLGRDVALKTLPEVFVADPQRVARFEREARMLATLNHPNIATLFGFEKQGGVLALVMELVEGDTLDEHMRRDAVPGHGRPLAEVIGFARQMVEALDFGLAKAIVANESGAYGTETRTPSPAETAPNVVMGTAAYMSPEQARGLPLDRRTDIWAFGCILYELPALDSVSTRSPPKSARAGWAPSIAARTRR